ncbi:hypothetical protein DESACE_07200 [Desulfurella acetivorans A63]|nr:hypothetical protein DESACE_07200 [Desulfurella acetivorans A63]
MDIGKDVVVVGADTAADAAMISKRWGANVTFAYRRTVPDKETFDKKASREALDAYEEVFAGGDVVGPRLMYVTTAIGHGFAAAANIIEHITGKKNYRTGYKKSYRIRQDAFRFIRNKTAP